MIDTHPYLTLEPAALEGYAPHTTIADSPRARRLALLVYEATLATQSRFLVADILERWARVLDDQAPDGDHDGKQYLALGAMLLRRVLDAPLGGQLTESDRADLQLECGNVLDADQAAETHVGAMGQTLAHWATVVLDRDYRQPVAVLARHAWVDATEMLWAVYLAAGKQGPAAAREAVEQCAAVVHRLLLGGSAP